MSQLILYSAPDLVVSEVSTYFPDSEVNIQFPMPGTVEKYELGDRLSGLSELNVQIRHPRGNPGFRISGFSGNDWLVLGRIDTDLFLSTVLYGGGAEVAACVAYCSDGTSGSPCVVCEEGGVFVRVCC